MGWGVILYVVSSLILSANVIPLLAIAVMQAVGFFSKMEYNSCSRVSGSILAMATEAVMIFLMEAAMLLPFQAGVVYIINLFLICQVTFLLQPIQWQMHSTILHC